MKGWCTRPRGGSAGVVGRIVVGAAQARALDPVGELAVDVRADALRVARQGEVDLGVGGDDVGQRALGLVQAAVVDQAVAVRIDAGVARRAVAEGVGAVEVGQHAARGVDDDHEAGTGVGERRHAGGVGERDAVIGDAARAAVLHRGLAGPAPAGYGA